MEGKPIGWRGRIRFGAVTRASILLPAITALLVAAAAPAGAQDPYQGGGEQEGQGEVQVGAGTTTAVTTGTSGTQPEVAAPEGPEGLSVPPPPDASLCDRIERANVRENCIEKIAR